MNNVPKIKVGIVAVSRDCFPERISIRLDVTHSVYILATSVLRFLRPCWLNTSMVLLCSALQLRRLRTT